MSKLQMEILNTDSLKLDGAIMWATRGLDIDQEIIKKVILSSYSQEIISKDMNKVLLSAAIELTTAQTPDWKIAAARFLLLDVYKVAAKNRKYSSFGYSGDYLGFLRDACDKGLYDSAIFDHYSEDEISVASHFLNPEYDMYFDYAGMNMIVNRCLIHERGNIYELPQEAFLTIALWLASLEKINRLDVVKQIYESIASREISLATPILLNLRKTGNLSSCFIFAVDDSLESIMQSVVSVGRISKNGGGVGVNLSRIRSAGASIKNTPGASGGVVPWIKIINDTAVAVNQSGKRAGAVTVALDIWHLDIFEFLELQTENGDPRKKAFDVFPQVVISDLFMERVNLNAEWTMFDPHEIREKYNVELCELWGKEFEEFYKKIELDNNIVLKKKTSAKNIIKEIMKITIETGMPYMFFKDTANNTNPNQHDGMIGSGNLCQESFSNFRPTKWSKERINDSQHKVTQDGYNGLAHTCNLVSINLANVREEHDIERVSRLCVRILDNTIDLTDTPIGESQFHNNRYRTIGVGALGLADYLAYNQFKYNEAADVVDKLFEKIAYFCTDESANLAIDRGAYEVFAGSEWSKGIMFGKDKNYFKSNSDMHKQWSVLIDKVQKYGIRNSQILAIAPNTSSSLIQGCTASILPVYSRFFVDKNSKGAVPICPPFLKERFWYYLEYRHANMLEIVEVVSRIQKWVDQGISFEMVFNLNSGLTAKDIFDVIQSAWKKKCKTIYYIRTIQKDGSSVDKEECVACAN